MAEKLKESEKLKEEKEAKKLKEKEEAQKLKLQQDIYEIKQRAKTHKTLNKSEATHLPEGVIRHNNRFIYTIYGYVGEPNVGGHYFDNLEDLPALKLRLGVV